MSTNPPILAAIVPKANAPEPESERAEEREAEQIEHFLEDGTVPSIPEDEFPENSVKQQAELARKRTQGR